MGLPGDPATEQHNADAERAGVFSFAASVKGRSGPDLDSPADRSLWPWPFAAEAPEAPAGPGGYPVALDARADTAWVAVYSPAAGHLEVARVTLGGAPPVSGDKIPIADPRKPAAGMSFVDTRTGWLVVSDSQHRQTAILRSGDGGKSWAATLGDLRQANAARDAGMPCSAAAPDGPRPAGRDPSAAVEYSSCLCTWERKE